MRNKCIRFIWRLLWRLLLPRW